ncbi:uncharacterized protein LODBEIA_P41680 [Lodderomyces beijingensis]|uniref:Uncharacterized protein n=1 Tax=Lodderomyces beijingensis TaxID=1775926 RepID=A0ABP0ZP64_9ASCO
MTEEAKLAQGLNAWHQKSSKQKRDIGQVFENVVADSLRKQRSNMKQLETIETAETAEAAEKEQERDVDNIAISRVKVTRLGQNDRDKSGRRVPYQTAKYWYNAVADVRYIKRPISSMRALQFFTHLQLQKEKQKENGNAELTSVQRAKIIQKSTRTWATFSSFQRNPFFLMLESNLLLGYDIDREYNLVTVEEKDGYSSVLKKRAGMPEPRGGATGETNKTNGSGSRRVYGIDQHVPKLRLLCIESTGFTLVDGLTDVHLWNYYLGKQFRQQKSEIELFTWRNYQSDGAQYGEVVREIEKTWLEMDKAGKEKLRLEYLNLLHQGKDMYEGEIVEVEFKNKMIQNRARYVAHKVRFGDPFLQLDKGNSIRRTNISRQTQLRLVKNLTVGTISIIDQVKPVHAWNFYMFKHLSKLQQRHSTTTSDREGYYRKLVARWENTPEEHEQCAKEYKNLLLSGRDIYKGRIIQLASSQAVHEMWGRPVQQVYESGRSKRLEPLAMLVHPQTGKVEILSRITADHAFNYYLAKRLNELDETHNLPKRNTLIPDLELEWSRKSKDEMQTLALEYRQLLQSGQDYLEGKLVPLEQKQERCDQMRMLRGRGTKAALRSPSETLWAAEQQAKRNGQAWQYYKYARIQFDHVHDVDEITKEWDEMSIDEKNDVYESYKMLESSGKVLINGELVTTNSSLNAVTSS